MANTTKEIPFYVGTNELLPRPEGGLIPGNIYSISIQSAPTRLSLINHALYINLEKGGVCTFITHLPLEEFLARCNDKEAHLFLRSIKEKKLFIFSMIGDYAKNIFRFGAERFLQEVEQFNVPDSSFIIVDHADFLFTSEDHAIAASQARTYRQWMRRTGNVGLFLFLDTVSNDAHSSSAYYQALTDYFSGVAGLYIRRNSLEMAVDFWSLPEGDIVARQFEVTTDSDGASNIVPSLLVDRADHHVSASEAEGHGAHSDAVEGEKEFFYTVHQLDERNSNLHPSHYRPPNPGRGQYR